MNPFLQIRLKLTAAIKRAERLYKENQVMKRRLLKYEKARYALPQQQERFK